MELGAFTKIAKDMSNMKTLGPKQSSMVWAKAEAKGSGVNASSAILACVLAGDVPVCVCGSSGCGGGGG